MSFDTQLYPLKRTESSISLSALNFIASLSASARSTDVTNKMEIIDKILLDKIQLIIVILLRTRIEAI